MKCMVIDDEPVAIDILTDYISKVDFLELVGAYRNSIKALKYLKIHPIDLLFLDINMPDLTGIQFLNTLDHHPLVIFTTAYSEYAVKSYDYQAVDYLLKPIEFERFLKAAGRAWSRYQSLGKAVLASSDGKKDDHDFLLIKSGTEIHRLSIKDILYVKGTGNYVTFVTHKKEIMSLMSMKKALSLLDKNRFLRIHKSYIISLNQIDVIEKDHVKLKNITIPIGEVYRINILNVLKKHK